VGLFVGFAVAATIAGQGVSEEQVSHWAETSGGRQAALTFLVSAKWTEGEAQERNVVVTQAEAERAVGEEPSRGLTHNDMVYKARLTLLTAGIREQIATPAAQSVTPEQVDAYVRGHPRTRPVRRRMHILQARTRHQAARAKDKIANGLTWRTAARRYGISGGARQKTVWPGDYDLNVEEALFKARINRLTRYRTFVFKVTMVIPSRPAPLQEQRAAAYEVLASEAQQTAIDAFTAEFREKWRARTTCAPTYESLPVCGPPPNSQEPG
jgi:hypothetical protein